MNQLKKKFKIEEGLIVEEEKRPIEEKPIEDLIIEEELDVLPAKEESEVDLILSRQKIKDLHNHNGTNSELVSVTNLFDFIETVTTIPTHKPRFFYEQYKIYIDDLTSPTVKRLYIY